MSAVLSGFAPEVFDILRDYAHELQGGQVDDELDDSSPALVFCHNFYAQFFKSVAGVEIQGFDLRGKEIAVRQRRRLKKAAEAKETILLITWFEKLCDIHPDVIRQGYGGPSAESFTNFHRYVLSLLWRVDAWAAAKGFEDIRTRAAAAREPLQRAVDARASS